jgi:hypothetical protein
MRLFAFTALLVASTSIAQTADEAALASVRSLKCEFPFLAVNEWEQDQPTPKLKKQDFAFHIDGIDLSQGKARIIGNAGLEDLVTIVGNGVLHFVERTPSGNLNVTSVFATRLKAHKFKAVHSRHVFIAGGPLPSQAYGYCQTWE